MAIVIRIPLLPHAPVERPHTGLRFAARDVASQPTKKPDSRALLG